MRLILAFTQSFSVFTETLLKGEEFENGFTRICVGATMGKYLNTALYSPFF